MLWTFTSFFFMSCGSRLKCHHCCNLYYVSAHQNGWRYIIHKSNEYRNLGYNITRTQKTKGRFIQETLIKDSSHYVAIVKDFFAWHGRFDTITIEEQKLLQRMSNSCVKVRVDLSFAPSWLGWYNTSQIK